MRHAACPGLSIDPGLHADDLLAVYVVSIGVVSVCLWPGLPLTCAARTIVSAGWSGPDQVLFTWLKAGEMFNPPLHSTGLYRGDLKAGAYAALPGLVAGG